MLQGILVGKSEGGFAPLFPDLQDHFGRKNSGNHSHCIEIQEVNGKIEDNSYKHTLQLYSVKRLRQINFVQRSRYSYRAITSYY